LIDMSTNPVKAGVGVLLHREGKILLGLRHEDPAKAGSELSGEGTWTMPGGSIEVGDTIVGAAKRELFEETGIVAKSLEILCANTDRKGEKQFVTIGVAVTEFEGEPKALEPDEIKEWKWFPLNALPSNMFSPSIKLLECYKKGAISLDK
jgi:8-oxo-dGTP diphosphatase